MLDSSKTYWWVMSARVFVAMADSTTAEYVTILPTRKACTHSCFSCSDPADRINGSVLAPNKMKENLYISDRPLSLELTSDSAIRGRIKPCEDRNSCLHFQKENEKIKKSKQNLFKKIIENYEFRIASLILKFQEHGILKHEKINLFCAVSVVLH
jgi:hypothetical protein